MDNKKQQQQKSSSAPQHNKGQSAPCSKPQQAPHNSQNKHAQPTTPAQPKKSGCCW